LEINKDDIKNVEVDKQTLSSDFEARPRTGAPHS
jgi:hypothetical protein